MSEIPYEMEPHAPAKLYKCIPWLVCKKCGLIYLKNDFTQWCIRMGCNNEDHPNYKAAMRGKL
jgi:hypothetical protein